MFDNLKTVDENYKQANEILISVQDKISDQSFEALYEDLITLAEEKKQKIAELEKSKFQEIQSHLDAIRQHEAEHAIAENPENLLQKL